MSQHTQQQHTQQQWTQRTRYFHEEFEKLYQMLDRGTFETACWRTTSRFDGNVLRSIILEYMEGGGKWGKKDIVSFYLLANYFSPRVDIMKALLRRIQWFDLVNFFEKKIQAKNNSRAKFCFEKLVSEWLEYVEKENKKEWFRLVNYENGLFLKMVDEWDAATIKKKMEKIAAQNVVAQKALAEKKMADQKSSTDRKTRQLKKITETCQEYKVLKTVTNLRGPIQRLLNSTKDEPLFDALKRYINRYEHNLRIEGEGGFNAYVEEWINPTLEKIKPKSPVVKKISPTSSRGRAIQELFDTLNEERLKRQALPTQIQKAQQGKKQCRQDEIEHYLENLNGPLERLFKMKDTGLMSLLLEFCEDYENPQQQKPRPLRPLNIAAFNEFLEAKGIKTLTPRSMRYRVVEELLQRLSYVMNTYRIYK